MHCLARCIAGSSGHDSLTLGAPAQLFQAAKITTSLHPSMLLLLVLLALSAFVLLALLVLLMPLVLLAPVLVAV